jgi:hypothetical protein
VDRLRMDVWGKLWDIATGQPGDPAKITLDPEDEGAVMLTWPDNSTTWLRWHNGGWQFPESGSSAPCDVAARDAF